MGSNPAREVFSSLVQLTSPGLNSDNMGQTVARAWPWSEVLKSAVYHGVLPLLYKNLKPVLAELPGEIGKELRRLYWFNTQRMLLFTAEIHRINQAFREQNMPCVFFKGPVLASLLYGDIHLRQSADIDVLTFPQFHSRAVEIITGLGYVINREGRISGRLKSWFPERMRDQSFFQVHKRIMVELHFRLLPGYLLDIKEEKQLLHEFVEARFDGHTLDTLANAPLFLYLCLHGAVHRFDQLIWLIDLARLRSLLDEPSLIALFRRAQAARLERPIIQVLSLLEEYYGCSLPAFAGPYAKNDCLQSILSTARDILVRSGSEEPADRWRKMVYLQQLRPGLGYKIRSLGGVGLRQVFHALFG